MGKRTMRRSTATGIEPEVRKPERVVRSVDENKERAYIAASRRSDRSIEDRMQSAHKASEIHKARTGKRLKITREAVEKELMFEEEDDAPRSASHLYHNSLGISMAHQEEVNREFEQTFGHLARHYSFSYRPTFAPQPWANPQADSALQQQEYAMGYHPQTMTAMPQYAQPVLDMAPRVASQPSPISPIELIQPYRPPVTLPLRQLTTEDSQSPAVVTPGQATISPISNTPSHPYNSASPPELATGSNSPSSMSDTDRPLKRKSIAVDSDSPPSYGGTGRPIKRRSISGDERIPSLTHSPDPAGDSDPDQPASPIKKEDNANIDPLLTDWTRVNPPSTRLVPQTNYLAFFDFDTSGGGGGATEYPELLDTTEAVKIAFDFPFGGTASFSPADVSDLAYDPNAWDDLIYVDGPPAAPP